MPHKPFYKDWIFYLWIASIIAITPGTLFSTLNGGGIGSFLIGVLFQSLIFLLIPTLIRNNLRARKVQKTDARNTPQKIVDSSAVTPIKNFWGDEIKNGNTDNAEQLVPVKICHDCGKEAENMWQMSCQSCEGTSFTHEKRPFVAPVETPKFKICSMCAEEIRYEAKKCRFCQHMQEEISGIPKSSIESPFECTNCGRTYNSYKLAKCPTCSASGPMIQRNQI